MRTKNILIFGTNSSILRSYIKKSLDNEINIIGISKTRDKYFENYKNFFFYKHDVLKNNNLDICKKISKKFKIDSIIFAVGGSLGLNKVFHDKKHWNTLWEYNFGYSIDVCNFFLKKFKKNNYGRILFFSSTITKNKKGPAIYSVSKKAIEDYVSKMGNNFSNNNVFINAISTSIVSEKGNNWYKFEKSKNKKSINKTLKEILSTNKFGRAFYFDDLIDILITEKNHFITSSVISADGGFIK
jgi:NADP-dependent 3-hydroxy acid dehydrogenase YdfG